MVRNQIEERSTTSVDFDGVLFPRIPAQLETLRPWSYNSRLKLHVPITAENRIVQAHILSPAEESELRRHAGRDVKPEAGEMVRQIKAGLIVGNTGRPNHTEMVRLTEKKLREGRIRDRFADIAFRPEGVSSDESKYWKLVELRNAGYTDITHFDDNARTVKRLAKELPDMRFVIVQDLTSGLLFSRREMEKYPNVARIALCKNGRIDVTHRSAGFGDLPVPHM